ncbi:hypothetical protein [Avibacterium sp. 21-594]|uniref:hypothetical protein n=1 Tax=Avibacterium sp. 21-594 TaxID=2911535 RepID=UPI0022474750|nr:hypothetical protein [Avibacterium sp. 21-594]MCW9715986.1 hypothetical protein [Avibacterium sp. 21-594]
MLADFILFWTKIFFGILIALSSLFLLFTIDMKYILAFFGIFVFSFVIRLIMVFAQTKKHYAELEKIKQEQARVKYVIIK